MLYPDKFHQYILVLTVHIIYRENLCSSKLIFLNNGNIQTATGSDSLHLVILDQDGIVVSSGVFA